MTGGDGEEDARADVLEAELELAADGAQGTRRVRVRRQSPRRPAPHVPRLHHPTACPGLPLEGAYGEALGEEGEGPRRLLLAAPPPALPHRRVEVKEGSGRVASEPGVARVGGRWRRAAICGRTGARRGCHLARLPSRGPFRHTNREAPALPQPQPQPQPKDQALHCVGSLSVDSPSPAPCPPVCPPHSLSAAPALWMRGDGMRGADGFFQPPARILASLQPQLLPIVVIEAPYSPPFAKKAAQSADRQTIVRTMEPLVRVSESLQRPRL